MNARESMAGNYLRNQFQQMDHDWMTSSTNRMLVGSDLDHAGNASEISTEGSHPNL